MTFPSEVLTASYGAQKKRNRGLKALDFAPLFLKSRSTDHTDLACKSFTHFPSRLNILSKRLRALTRQQMPERSSVAL